MRADLENLVPVPVSDYSLSLVMIKTSPIAGVRDSLADEPDSFSCGGVAVGARPCSCRKGVWTTRLLREATFSRTDRMNTAFSNVLAPITL